MKYLILGCSRWHARNFTGVKRKDDYFQDTDEETEPQITCDLLKGVRHYMSTWR